MNVRAVTALALPTVPEPPVIIGAEAIGLELGAVWSGLGADVRIVALTRACSTTINPQRHFPRTWHLACTCNGLWDHQDTWDRGQRWLVPLSIGSL